MSTPPRQEILFITRQYDVSITILGKITNTVLLQSKKSLLWTLFFFWDKFEFFCSFLFTVFFFLFFWMANNGFEGGKVFPFLSSNFFDLSSTFKTLSVKKTLYFSLNLETKKKIWTRITKKTVKSVAPTFMWVKKKNTNNFLLDGHKKTLFFWFGNFQQEILAKLGFFLWGSEQVCSKLLNVSERKSRIDTAKLISACLTI